MKAQILKQLLQAHADGDEDAFRRAALQLAASESSAGHIKIAEQLRQVIAKLPTRSVGDKSAIDIAQPRGEIADLLSGGHRDERLKDIVLPQELRKRLVRLIHENREREALGNWGISPRRKLLLYGPPGCGKTLAASVLAGELGLPLMTVRFDGLFSRFLGATASHLKTIFDEMPRRPAVYLFDEFDAIAKSRGDTQEVGEVRRVVTSFLQLMDADRSGSVIAAATNYDGLLDHAVFRRFDVILHLELPSRDQLEELIRMRLRPFDIPLYVIRNTAECAEGLSFADASRACDDAIRTMVLDRRRHLGEEDLKAAFSDAVQRPMFGKPLR